jgi:hypothetical protein
MSFGQMIFDQMTRKLFSGITFLGLKAEIQFLAKKKLQLALVPGTE